MKKRLDAFGIYSVQKGTVLYCLPEMNENGKKSDYGNRVYIRHDDGSTTMYAHLQTWLVTNGQEVEEGQCIGYMGDTGYGAKHLHLSYFAPGTTPLTAANTSNPVPFIKAGAYPCNTKCTNPFGSMYCNPRLSHHEGIDFSGLEENLIKGWKEGIDPLKQRYDIS